MGSVFPPCYLPGAKLWWIFWAGVLEWVAVSFSKESSQPRDWTWVSCIVDRWFTVWVTREVLNYGGGNEEMVTSLKRPHACTATDCAPDPAAGHHWPTPRWRLPNIQRQVSCGVTVPSSLVLALRVCCALQECISQSYVSSCSSMVGLMAILQEDLCHTHTQGPCPCSRPLPTCTSTGDAQTQFCLSLCGVLGPGAHKVSLSSLSISDGNGVWFQSPLLPFF